MKDVRTWIEIDAQALRHNAEQFLKLIPERTRLIAVIKSNAYGHGLVQIATQLARSIPDSRLWFGADSIVEALRLRKEGIANPILVLGYTLPSRVGEAVGQGITLTVSNFEALVALAACRPRPAFHLKIDTGMHRQGFFSDQIGELITTLKNKRLKPEGIYTHFASAKDPEDTVYTDSQSLSFKKVIDTLAAAGFTDVIRHAAASGATLLFPKTHLDMVRVGMGLYGYWPSPEARDARHVSRDTKIVVKPVLTWKTIIAEVKDIPEGARVGYDETEAVGRKSKIAVLPIGYWHGYDRGLSSIGEVLIHGKRAKILGRISMDMTVVDVTDTSGVKVGDEVVLVGMQSSEGIFADELAERIGTTQYELLTRINPLIRRIVV